MAAKAPKAKLRIRRWDPTELKPTNTILILGKRNTGKSVLVRHLCYLLRDHLQGAVAFCPTEGAQGVFGSFVPPSLIHEEYNAAVLDTLMQTQRRQWKRGHGSHVMAILDDCAYDTKTFSSTSLRNIFYNGRHNRIGLIMTLQYSMAFPPALRTNCDYVIACREQILSNRERLYNHFFGMFPSKDAFNRAFSACTSDYEVMVLKNDSQSNRLEDCVFWFKAQYDVPSFRIGADSMWPLHDAYHVGDDDSDGDTGSDGGGAGERRDA